MTKYRFIYSNGEDGLITFSNDLEAINYGVKSCSWSDDLCVYIWKKLPQRGKYSFVGKYSSSGLIVGK